MHTGDDFIDRPHRVHTALCDGAAIKRMAQPDGLADRIGGVRTVNEEIAAQLFDKLAGAGKVNFVKAVAYPLPVLVTCELLPVLAQEDRP